MPARRFTTALAILVAGAGVSAFAGTAQAAVVVDNDLIGVDGANVDFNGTVSYSVENGVMTPRVTGTLGITNGQNTRGRIRIDSYDGATLLGSVQGNDLEPPSNGLQNYAVNRTGFADPLVDKVVVTTEFENAQNVFEPQDASTTSLSTHDDDVLVLGTGIDIGAPGGLVGGAPNDVAQMEWDVVDGVVTPELVDEKLHLTNMVGVCGRIKLRFLEEDGTFIDRAESSPDCPTQNGHAGYATNDIPLVSSPLITQVEVQMQTDTAPGGGWATVDSTTVSIAE